MTAAQIDRIDAARRASTVRRAQQSSALEGGRSSRAARALQRRWAVGEITYEQFGAELEQLRPTLKSSAKTSSAHGLSSQRPLSA